MVFPLPSMEFLVAIIPGGVGYLELLLLFALILVLFGPDRLPALARKLGHLLEQLRKSASMFQQNLLSMDDDVTEDESYDDRLHSSGSDEEGEGDGSAR